MPQARVVAQRHAHYGRGDVFNASEAEMASFGDKLELIPSATVFDELNISAGAIVLCEKFNVDPMQIDGTGKAGQITVNDVMAYIALRDVAVIKGDGKEVIRTSGDGEINATRPALDLARESGISTNDIEGSGADGRILKKDVLAHIDEHAAENHQVDEVEPPDAETTEPSESQPFQLTVRESSPLAGMLED